MPAKPHGYFRPSWSPDGKWLAFSSDTGTNWRGHDLPTGWERTQESSIHIIKPDGSGWKTVATHPGSALGSPSWSPDGTSLVFYETPVESTWGARRPELINTVSSQLVSVNVASLARTALTTSAGFKVFPQYLDATTVAYHVKGGSTEGLYTTAGTFRSTAGTGLRSPRYSADGTKLVYEKIVVRARACQRHGAVHLRCGLDLQVHSTCSRSCRRTARSWCTPRRHSTRPSPSSTRPTSRATQRSTIPPPAASIRP
jgi:hypothetical protein